MKPRYVILALVVIVFSLVYYFVLYKTKTKPVNNKQSQLSLQEMVNANTTLEGKATNAKAGAMVLVGNDPVYVDGLDSWSKNFLDKQVSISGKLVVKSFIPKAEVNKSGEISQGGSGDEDYVLEDVDVQKYK